MGSAFSMRRESQKKSIDLNQQSRFRANDFNKKQWMLVKQYQNITQLRNLITNEEIDKYFIQFENKKDQKIYYQCYLQRLHEEYIVNTIHYQNIQTSNQFCSDFNTAYVYIEHIPIRLSDITDIPFPENIYILKHSLIGFSILYEIIGYFDVLEEHICIDKYGAIKVWMNEDLWKNYPEQNEIQFIEQNKCQLQMVSAIVSMVEDNSEEESYFPRFSDYLETHYKVNLGFDQILKAIDSFIKQYQIKVPEYCESILEIFEDISSTITHKQSKIIKNIPAFRNQNTPHRNSYRNSQMNSENGEKSQIINNIHIPRLPIGADKTIRKSIIQKKTAKKSQIPNQKFDKVLPKNLVTDRTVPLYQDFTRLNNLTATDRSNFSNLQHRNVNFIHPPAPQLKFGVPQIKWTNLSVLNPNSVISPHMKYSLIQQKQFPLPQNIQKYETAKNKVQLASQIKNNNPIKKYIIGEYKQQILRFHHEPANTKIIEKGRMGKDSQYSNGEDINEIDQQILEDIKMYL